MKNQRVGTNSPLGGESHQAIRNLLRVVGPLVLLVGVVFMAVGVVSFFSSFGSSSPPRFFWCCFVGMPLMFVGLVTSSAGFAGAVARYQANEIAPVGKDTFNYLADGTQDGVRTMANAVASGLASGAAGAADSDGLVCHGCGAGNEAGSRFCDQCGEALEKTCPACGAVNDHAARFCDGCGTAV